MTLILHKIIKRKRVSKSSAPGYGSVSINDMALIPGTDVEIEIIVKKYKGE